MANWKMAFEEALNKGGFCATWKRALDRSDTEGEFLNNLRDDHEYITSDMEEQIEDLEYELRNKKDDYEDLEALAEEAGVKLRMEWVMDRQKVITALKMTQHL